jgi:transposase-like protein
MRARNPFKWRHFEGELILLCVRWYLRYSLSDRDLEEMMLERGVVVDHTTVYRWVQHYAPELDKRCRPLLRSTNDSYRVDETYIRVKGQWKYLYRAVDSEGNTLDFLLRAKRDKRAAKRFFAKILGASQTITPRVINVDQNAAYPVAFAELQDAGVLPSTTRLRPCKYLNNIVEQDHRFIKRRVCHGLGFASFRTAWRTLRGYEMMNRVRKGQLAGAPRGDIVSQNRLIAGVFGLAA